MEKGKCRVEMVDMSRKERGDSEVRKVKRDEVRGEDGDRAGKWK